MCLRHVTWDKYCCTHRCACSCIERGCEALLAQEFVVICTCEWLLSQSPCAVHYLGNNQCSKLMLTENTDQRCAGDTSRPKAQRRNSHKGLFDRAAVLCCAVLCCAVLCCAVPCRAVPCCVVLCCAVLCHVVLSCHCSVLCHAQLRYNKVQVLCFTERGSCDLAVSYNPCCAVLHPCWHVCPACTSARLSAAAALIKQLHISAQRACTVSCSASYSGGCTVSCIDNCIFSCHASCTDCCSNKCRAGHLHQRAIICNRLILQPALHLLPWQFYWLTAVAVQQGCQPFFGASLTYQYSHMVTSLSAKVYSSRQPKLLLSSLSSSVDVSRYP